MIVTATCTMECFDNDTSRHYFPGEVIPNFDTESKVASLKSPRGIPVFKWEGKVEAPAEEEAAVKRGPGRPSTPKTQPETVTK